MVLECALATVLYTWCASYASVIACLDVTSKHLKQNSHASAMNLKHKRHI